MKAAIWDTFEGRSKKKIGCTSVYVACHLFHKCDFIFQPSWSLIKDKFQTIQLIIAQFNIINSFLHHLPIITLYTEVVRLPLFSYFMIVLLFSTLLNLFLLMLLKSCLNPSLLSCFLLNTSKRLFDFHRLSRHY